MIEYRPIQDSELQLLPEFMYLSIHQEDPENPIPRSVLHVPEVAAYISDWGRDSDHCVVAVEGGEVIGAAWARIISGEVTGYGNIDASTPEFAISVQPNRRGQGVGGALMRALITELGEAGYERASLSVQKTNRAFGLYSRLGFEIVENRENDYLMSISPVDYVKGSEKS